MHTSKYLADSEAFFYASGFLSILVQLLNVFQVMDSEFEIKLAFLYIVFQQHPKFYLLLILGVNLKFIYLIIAIYDKSLISESEYLRHKCIECHRTVKIGAGVGSTISYLTNCVIWKAFMYQNGNAAVYKLLTNQPIIKTFAQIQLSKHRTYSTSFHI